MSALDLTTAPGALLFCDRMRQDMVRCFDRLGRFVTSTGFSVCAYVFATHELDTSRQPLDPARWRTGAALPSVQARLVQVPRFAHAFITAETLGPRFGAMVRAYCELSRAVGVVTLNEMWWGQTESLEQRAERPERIEDWDDRGEVLYLNLEHRAVGKRAWRAQIDRNPTRLGPWVQLGGVLGGHLTCLLDGKDQAPA